MDNNDRSNSSTCNESNPSTNDYRTGYGLDNLVELAIEQARRYGEKPLYQFLDQNNAVEENVSYSQLDRSARRWASLLKKCHIARGERALLLFGHQPCFIDAFWGCLYAGVVAVPVFPPKPNNAHAIERLMSIVEDCRPAIILTSDSFLPTATHIQAELAKRAVQTGAEPASPTAKMIMENAGHAAQISSEMAAITIAASAQAREQDVPETDPLVPASDDLAFLQYTSGSTGAPKGVMIDHGNLMANEAAITKNLTFSDKDVLFSWLPFYHDMGLIGCIIQALYSGCSAVLIPPIRFVQSPLNWFRGLSQYRATIVMVPNFAFDHCCEKIDSADLSGIDLSSIRVLVNGSEPINPATMQRFAHAFWQTGIRPTLFVPGYGLAEATLLVSSHPATTPLHLVDISRRALQNNRVAAPEQARDTLTLVANGPVIDNHRVVIVDPLTSSRREDNLIGEICVAGPSVSRGYWRKPELSATVFGLTLDRLPGRFLRTGDYGFTRNGQLFITGREKELIILRGQNFYPQDLERAIERQVDHVPSGRVVAFAVSREEREHLIIVVEPNRRGIKRNDFTAIAQRCKLALSAAMGIVADEIIVARLGTITKTSSGKTQRTHCKERYLNNAIDFYTRLVHQTPPPLSADKHDFSTASGCATFLTRHIAAVAAVDPSLLDEHLPLDTLGLDSMHMAELLEAVQFNTGVSLSIEQILTGATVHSLAQNIVQAAGVAEKTCRDPVPSSGDDLTQPLDSIRVAQSFQQQRLWFLHQMDSGAATAHNIVVELRFANSLDPERLRASFSAIARRHEVLRTVFIGQEGKPLQQIRADMPLDFDVSAVAEEHLRQYSEALVCHPFDLDKGPLWKVRLMVLSKHDCRLLLAFHHIIFDGISANILCRELADLYGGETSPPPLQYQYKDYAAWQQRQVDSGRWEAHLDFWRSQLRHSRATALDSLSLIGESSNGESSMGENSVERGWRRAEPVPVTLDRDTHTAVHNFARQRQLTPFMVLLGAFYTALYHETGETDLTVGTDTANRPLYQWRQQLGFFVNQLALRLQFDPTQSAEDFFAALRTRTLAAYEHQSFPFDRIVSVLNPPRESHRTPFFTTKLVWQRLELDALRRGEFKLDDIQIHQSTSEFDMVLDFVESPRGLKASINFNPTRLSAEQVARFAQHYSLALNTLLYNSRLSIQRVGQRLSQWDIDHLREHSPGPTPVLKRRRRRAGKSA